MLHLSNTLALLLPPTHLDLVLLNSMQQGPSTGTSFYKALRPEASSFQLIPPLSRPSYLSTSTTHIHIHTLSLPPSSLSNPQKDPGANELVAARTLTGTSHYSSPISGLRGHTPPRAIPTARTDYVPSMTLVQSKMSFFLRALKAAMHTSKSIMKNVVQL
jgi:hypothetical protein